LVKKGQGKDSISSKVDHIEIDFQDGHKAYKILRAMFNGGPNDFTSGRVGLSSSANRDLDALFINDYRKI
jgi:hypothetical protein